MSCFKRSDHVSKGTKEGLLKSSYSNTLVYYYLLISLLQIVLTTHKKKYNARIFNSNKYRRRKSWKPSHVPINVDVWTTSGKHSLGLIINNIVIDY
jgi:hypothetical protein